jgi:hypothetical protein
MAHDDPEHMYFVCINSIPKEIFRLYPDGSFDGNTQIALMYVLGELCEKVRLQTAVNERILSELSQIKKMLSGGE